MRRQSEEFGKRVREVLEAHGNMSNRAADRKTGVSYATISNMSVGQIPEMESVVKFARGFGLDVNDWLVLAGFDPIPLPAYNGGGHFILGLRRLAARYGEERVGSIRFAQFPGPDTPIEHVEQALRDLETDIRQELGAR